MTKHIHIDFGKGKYFKIDLFIYYSLMQQLGGPHVDSATRLSVPTNFLYVSSRLWDQIQHIHTGKNPLVAVV